VLALYFFLRSRKDGYWSKESEDVRYQVFAGDERNGCQAPMPEPRPLGGDLPGSLGPKLTTHPQELDHAAR
jgi:hypothetical protein